MADVIKPRLDGQQIQETEVFSIWSSAVSDSYSGSDRRRIAVVDCEYCAFYSVALSLAIQVQHIDIGSLLIASEMITIEPVVPSGFFKPCTTGVALTIG